MGGSRLRRGIAPPGAPGSERGEIWGSPLVYGALVSGGRPWTGSALGAWGRAGGVGANGQKPRSDMPKRAAPKAILSAIQHRFQQRLDHEHMRATHAADTCHDARAQFHLNWIATGVATTRAHGPRTNFFSRTPPNPPPAPGVHIQVAAAYLPATRVQPPTAGWALQAFLSRRG